MQNKKRSFIAGILTAGMFLSSFAFVSAESASSSPSISVLTEQVQNLLAQIGALQAQLAKMQKEIISVKQELAITRTLAFGSKGKDVSDLQEFLSSFPDIYPEGLVTGFFGHATEEAIKRLQEKHGLEKAGVVGPKTRKQIQSLFSEHGNKGKEKRNGLSVKHKDEEDNDEEGNENDDDHLFASSTAGVAKIVICHKKEKKHGGETIMIGSPALPAHLAHGDTLGACGTGGGTTTPDTVAPILSNVTATSTAATMAKITWSTNENADSTVWYGISSPIDIIATTTARMDNTTLVFSHELSLSGLAATTTYHYIVGSKDASGNQATSTGLLFMTLGL